MGAGLAEARHAAVALAALNRATITLHGAGNVVVIVQGKLEKDAVLAGTGIMATVRKPKAGEVEAAQ